jgi:hypothetical protein
MVFLGAARRLSVYPPLFLGRVAGDEAAFHPDAAWTARWLSAGLLDPFSSGQPSSYLLRQQVKFRAAVVQAHITGS